MPKRSKTQTPGVASAPGIITQGELELVLAVENVKRTALLALRARLEAGLSIEPGPLTAAVEPNARPVENGQRPPVGCVGFGVESLNVTVGPAEWYAAA